MYARYTTHRESPRPTSWASALGLVIYALTSAVGVASARPSEGFPLTLRTSAGQQGVEYRVALRGGVGLGGLGGDALSTVEAGISLSGTKTYLELFGRLRLRLDRDIGANDGLSTSTQGNPLIRRRDFDEASDYVHILRDFSSTHRIGRGGQLRLRAGELRGYTLGHGSLILDYATIADPDHLHSGARLEFESERGDGILLIDNIARPSIFAGRVGLRPWTQFQRITFGASFVVDARAPARILVDSANRPLVDDTHSLRTDNLALTLFNLDTELVLGSPDIGNFIPYIDLNGTQYGTGIHLGARARLALGLSGFDLNSQLEYRATSGGYAPAAIDTFYDITRYQASLRNPARTPTNNRGTFVQTLKNGAYSGQGILAQVGLDAEHLGAVKVGYRYHPGPDAHRAWLRTSLTPHRNMVLGMMLMLRGLERAPAVATVAEARYLFNKSFYTFAHYSRLWALADVSHTYQTLQGFNIGLGTTFAH